MPVYDAFITGHAKDMPIATALQRDSDAGKTLVSRRALRVP
jgi:hypothetical protein